MSKIKVEQIANGALIIVQSEVISYTKYLPSLQEALDALPDLITGINKIEDLIKKEVKDGRTNQTGN